MFNVLNFSKCSPGLDLDFLDLEIAILSVGISTH